MFEAIGLVGVRAGEHLANLVACAATVAADARSAARWDSVARVAALASLDAAVAAVAEARAHLLVADRDAGDSQGPGDRSFEAARARLTRAGVGDARRQVQQADALVSMPAVAAGVRDGSVPLGHLDVLARVAAAASPQVAAVLRSVEVQQDVVHLARTQSAPDLARALARFVAAQDPAGLEASHQDQYRERFLSVSTQPHGVFLKGRLDVTAGQSLLVALDAMGQHPDETRTPGQACGDALVMLAERICAGTPAVSAAGDLGIPTDHSASERGLLDGVSDGATAPVASGTTSRTHISLLVPAETFAQLLGHEQARRAAQRDRRTAATRGTHTGSAARSGSVGDSGRDSGADRRRQVAPHWAPVAPATLEDGTPVAMSELARCLCDADITRIVLAADSQPLDVGRTRRLHTPAQRKAVIARDRQCVWNGCETPAARCEVHHIIWWNRDHGPTSVDQAALGCRHHHGEIHRQDLSLERLTPPPGTQTGAPMRYVFRNPDGVVVNKPPGWAEPGTPTQPSARLDGAGHTGADGTQAGSAVLLRDGANIGPRAAPLASAAGPRAGVHREAHDLLSAAAGGSPDARREAREQVAFALFESDGPPPDWATR